MPEIKRRSNDTKTTRSQAINIIVDDVTKRISINQWGIYIDRDPESQIDVRDYDDLDDLVEVVCNALGTKPNRHIRSKIYNTWLKYCINPTIVTDDYLKQESLNLEQLCNLSIEQLERSKALLGIKESMQVIRKRNGTYVFRVIKQ